MTTHRIDTISLLEYEGNSQNSTILVLKKKKDNKIVLGKSKKLNAIFQLTRNLRILFNVHINVFVESHEDALLYQAFYFLIKDIFQILRPRTELSSDLILSRRYLLKFQTSGIGKRGGEGGFRKVFTHVDRVSQQNTLIHGNESGTLIIFKYY